ncbi:hypothetical protein [Streptomyces liangshanensis]|uniref:hypothetical protein n=1 Tax=Streptomyces liangshanensis TaxID=2717324 RepID=UPI0036DF0863
MAVVLPVQPLGESVAEVGAQLVPVFGDEADDDLIDIPAVEDLKSNAGRTWVAEGFLNAVDQCEVAEHEHADPRQLVAFLWFRAVGAQLVPDLTA